MNMSKRAVGLACAASLVLAACGSSGDTKAGGTTASTAKSTESTAAGGTKTSDGAAKSDSLLNGEINCEQQFADKTVQVFSPVRDSDNDKPIADYVAGYQPLVDCTGVEIDWQGTDQFETEVNVRLEGGDPPDVIDYPQPGLLAGNARKGYLHELPADVAAHTKGDFLDPWADYSTVDGKVYGIPGRSNIKSLIWYSPEAFKAKGYQIPKSLEDLKALSEKIVADGGVPWCVGAESGVATGWVLTDWMEDFMLRVNGEDVYDQWVSHKIPFNDPKVAAVADAVGAYVKNPAYLGGENNVKAIATTKFQDGGLPILSGKCYLHRQASFYSGLWPKGTKIGADGAIDFFYLPSPASGPKFMLGAGDIYAAGTDKPETYAVLAYTGSVDYQTYLVNKRGELSPNKGVKLEDIKDPLVKRFTELQNDADVFRFDASDQMPGAVGSGTLWTEITKWVTGGSTQDFVDNVEKSWPKS
jgi:alpha-glucoside transport system substrate-binding protein